MGTEEQDDVEDPRASAEILVESVADDQLYRYLGTRDRREAIPADPRAPRGRRAAARGHRPYR